MGSCGKWTSALVLLAVNCVLLAGGIAVLVVTLNVRGTAWVDVVRSYVSATDSVLTAIEVVAIVVIALAVLGSIAAVCRWRLGLLLYAVAVVLLFLAFVAVAVAALILRGTASDWASATYPASADEPSIKREFDSIYCAAQGEYICNSLTVADAVAMFAPQLNSSVLVQSFRSVVGVGTLCDALLNQVAGLQAVCEGCARASAFKNLTDVFDWANDQCPRTQQTLLWCGTLLSTGSASTIAVGTAPYTQCRSAFLDLVESTSLYIGVGSIVVCVGALLVVSFSCYLRRRDASSASSRRHSSDALDRGDHDPYTPTAARAMYSKT